MADPTAAEIEAGAAAITRLGIAIGPHMRQVIAAAVLRAALPDHDAQVRADERARVAEEIAQAIEARAAVARRTVALEPSRHDEDAAIARQHATTREDT